MKTDRKHLRRLDDVWIACPIYFLTACTLERRRLLANDDFHTIAVEVWQTCERLYGWLCGRYVIMPDHVHFFGSDDREVRALSMYVGKWKEWTAKYASQRLGYPVPLWQPEFFDHVPRSPGSYEEKWNYALNNPVRAGLVKTVQEWKFQGELNEL